MAQNVQENQIRIVIPGKPFAKQRPRFSTRSGQAFTPSETVSFERAVGLIAAKKIETPLDGPLRLDIRAFFTPAASKSRKRRAAMVGTPHVQRPDLDNIQKAILDGLNRIAFGDDSQVAEMSSGKEWDDRERTEITITRL